MKTHQNDVSKP